MAYRACRLSTIRFVNVTLYEENTKEIDRLNNVNAGGLWVLFPTGLIGLISFSSLWHKARSILKLGSRGYYGFFFLPFWWIKRVEIAF